MLATAETVRMVSQALRQHNVPTTVMDPVFILSPADDVTALTRIYEGNDIHEWIAAATV